MLKDEITIVFYAILRNSMMKKMAFMIQKQDIFKYFQCND